MHPPCIQCNPKQSCGDHLQEWGRCGVPGSEGRALKCTLGPGSMHDLRVHAGYCLSTPRIRCVYRPNQSKFGPHTHVSPHKPNVHVPLPPQSSAHLCLPGALPPSAPPPPSLQSTPNGIRGGVNTHSRPATCGERGPIRGEQRRQDLGDQAERYHPSNPLGRVQA